MIKIEFNIYDTSASAVGSNYIVSIDNEKVLCNCNSGTLFDNKYYWCSHTRNMFMRCPAFEEGRFYRITNYDIPIEVKEEMSQELII